MAQWDLIAVLFIFGFLSRWLSGGTLTRSILVGLIAMATGLLVTTVRMLAEMAKIM